jgi:cytochrome c-type biogenesis protein CcmF
VAAGEAFRPVSREGALVVNNLLLAVMLAIILIGTLYPLALEGLTGVQISVGPPYFNRALAPLLLAMAAVMAVGPWLGWKLSPTGHLVRVLAPAAVAGVAAALVAVVAFHVRTAGAVLGFGLALWLGVASVELLVRRRTFASAGMALAHLGVAVSMLGATASGALDDERLVMMRVGDRVAFGPWQAELRNVRPVAGPNWTAIEAEVGFRREGRAVATVRPQSRTYTSPPMETTEAGIAPLLGGDLYVVLGKPDGSGRWQMNLRFKPLVRLLWGGGLLVALGGMVALGGHLALPLWRRRPRRRAAGAPA